MPCNRVCCRVMAVSGKHTRYKAFALHQTRESIACNERATAHVALRSLVNRIWTEDMLQRRYRETWQIVSPDTAADLPLAIAIFPILQATQKLQRVKEDQDGSRVEVKTDFHKCSDMPFTARCHHDVLLGEPGPQCSAEASHMQPCPSCTCSPHTCNSTRTSLLLNCYQ